MMVMTMMMTMMMVMIMMVSRKGGVRVEGEGGGQSGVTESYTAQSVVISDPPWFVSNFCQATLFLPMHIRCSVLDIGENNLPINEAFFCLKGAVSRTMGRTSSQNCRPLYSSQSYEDPSLLLEVNHVKKSTLQIAQLHIHIPRDDLNSNKSMAPPGLKETFSPTHSSMRAQKVTPCF